MKCILCTHVCLFFKTIFVWQPDDGSLVDWNVELCCNIVNSCVQEKVCVYICIDIYLTHDENHQISFVCSNCPVCNIFRYVWMLTIRPLFIWQFWHDDLEILIQSHWKYCIVIKLIKVQLIFSLTLITGPTFEGLGHGKVTNSKRSLLHLRNGPWRFTSVCGKQAV